MRLGLPIRLAFGALLLCATSAAPCSLIDPLPTPTVLVNKAGVIVAAVARELVPKPPTPTPPPYRNPDLPAWLPTPNQPRLPVHEPFPSENAGPSRADHIKFEVTQTLKGASDKILLIQGRVADADDFNETPVPSNWVRKEGRGGMCYASTYRLGAAYLLLLNTVNGRLSPYWNPLSRVNDQIRPSRDPWLDWVRQRVTERSASR